MSCHLFFQVSIFVDSILLEYRVKGKVETSKRGNRINHPLTYNPKKLRKMTVAFIEQQAAKGGSTTVRDAWTYLFFETNQTDLLYNSFREALWRDGWDLGQGIAPRRKSHINKVKKMRQYFYDIINANEALDMKDPNRKIIVVQLIFCETAAQLNHVAGDAGRVPYLHQRQGGEDSLPPGGEDNLSENAEPSQGQAVNLHTLHHRGRGDSRDQVDLLSQRPHGIREADQKSNGGSTANCIKM